jgi:hypothetical protein
MHDLDPTVVATELPQLRFDLSGIANKKEFADVGILAQRERGAATRLGGPKSPPIASSAIFMRGSTLRLSRG